MYITTYLCMYAYTLSKHLQELFPKSNLRRYRPRKNQLAKNLLHSYSVLCILELN